jgi:hypothetical protein
LRRAEWLEDWRRWTQLTATARDNLYFIPSDRIQHHTPLLLDGAECCASSWRLRARICNRADRGGFSPGPDLLDLSVRGDASADCF